MQVAGYTDLRLRNTINSNSVKHADCLHNHANLVISVFTFSDNVQTKINFT